MGDALRFSGSDSNRRVEPQKSAITGLSRDFALSLAVKMLL